MSTNNIQINRTKLLLSVQRALLGAISSSVLAICVNVTDTIELLVFAQGELPTEEREALDMSATEITGDFGPHILVDVKIIENVPNPLPCSGSWVFFRFGCFIETPSVANT